MFDDDLLKQPSDILISSKSTKKRRPTSGMDLTSSLHLAVEDNLI